MAAITFGNVAGNWSDTSKWIGGVLPTSADDVYFNSSSANCTLDINGVCRSLDFTGYTHTFTHPYTTNLTIGYSTNRSDNVGLIMGSGMTYAPAYIYSNISTFNFVSSAAAQSTIKMNGIATAALVFNTTGGGISQQDNITSFNTESTWTLVLGNYYTNNFSISAGYFYSNAVGAKSLYAGSSSFISNGTTGSTHFEFFVPLSGSVDLSAASLFLPGSYGRLRLVANGTTGLTVNRISVSSMAGLQDWQILYATIHNIDLVATGAYAQVQTTSFKVTNSFSITGAVGIRPLLRSPNTGVQSTIDNTGCTMAASYLDVEDIAMSVSWDIHAITGYSGDCGGNSNITFTASDTENWNNVNGGNWNSAANWTGASISRVPLPQDKVTFVCAFGSNKTIQTNYPRLGGGGGWDWTGVSWTGTLSFSLTATSSINVSVFGRVTLPSASGFVVTGSYALILSARSINFTLTSHGNSLTQLWVDSPGCEITMGDALTLTTNLKILSGRFITNGFTLTTPCINSLSNQIYAGIDFGASQVYIPSIVFSAVQPGIQLDASIAIASSSATLNFNFSAGTAGITQYLQVPSGITFAGVNVQGDTVSSPVLLFIGSPESVGALAVTTGSRTLQFNGAITMNVTSFSVPGTAGNVVTIKNSYAGTASTWSCASGTIVCNYLDIKDNHVGGGAVWRAGLNSTIRTNVTGWNILPSIADAIYSFFSLDEE